jgi:hypothetical protein
LRRLETVFVGVTGGTREPRTSKRRTLNFELEDQGVQIDYDYEDDEEDDGGRGAGGGLHGLRGLEPWRRGK